MTRKRRFNTLARTSISRITTTTTWRTTQIYSQIQTLKQVRYTEKGRTANADGCNLNTKTYIVVVVLVHAGRIYVCMYLCRNERLHNISSYDIGCPRAYLSVSSVLGGFYNKLTFFFVSMLEFRNSIRIARFTSFE